MAVMPWREPQDFRTRMSQLKNTAAIGVLLRDRAKAE
jgi:hypothetical protein